MSGGPRSYPPGHSASHRQTAGRLRAICQESLNAIRRSGPALAGHYCTQRPAEFTKAAWKAKSPLEVSGILYFFTTLGAPGLELLGPRVLTQASCFVCAYPRGEYPAQ